MKLRLPGNKSNLGQSLIEILIAVAVFSILAQAIFTLVGTSFSLVSYNRSRITARLLAQEKIEFIRNLPYDNAGTIGGIPSGPLPQDETVIRNKLSYNVKTTIVYIDDPFDDMSPTDLLATDYKRVRVEVSWEGLASSRNSPVVLLSDIAPKDIETTAGDGTLSIFVYDESAAPVQGAQVRIVASSVTPAVDLTLQTPSNGKIILPGAPVCSDNCYQITVTKDGYTSDRTYSTTEVATPNNPNQNVLLGGLTEVYFAIDKVSTLDIATFDSRENDFAPLGGVSFRLRGEKTIGTDTSGQTIYKYDEILTTNESGTLNLTDFGWDTYELTLQPSSSYDISGTNPLRPIVVHADTAGSFSFALTPKTTNNLMITFQDSSQALVASVSATLSDGLGFEQTKLSGSPTDPDFGQVFFSGLSEKTYHLEATASGFLNANNDFPVSGQTQEVVTLTPE